MALKIIKASKEYESLIKDMLFEWTSYNKAHPEANTSPYAILSVDPTDFTKYIKAQEDTEDIRKIDPKYVPSSQYFVLDEDNNQLVGAFSIRHYLNESLKVSGGHIGDGVRPSCRGKGFGKVVLKLAIEEARRLGIKDIMISCSKDNIASKKCILANNAIFINEVVSQGEEMLNFIIK